MIRRFPFGTQRRRRKPGEHSVACICRACAARRRQANERRKGVAVVCSQSVLRIIEQPHDDA